MPRGCKIFSTLRVSGTSWRMFLRLPVISAGKTRARRRPESGGSRYATALALLIFLTAPARSATLIWTGAFNNSWSFFAGFPSSNWNGFLPTGGDDVLVFPSGGANKTMDNDYADNTNFVQLRFTGAGYTLEGNSIDLVRDIASDTAPEIAVTHGAGTTAIAVDITAVQSLPISVTNAAAVLELRREMTVTGGSVTISGQGTVALGFIVDADFTASFNVGTGSDAPTLISGGTITGNVLVRDEATLAGRAFIGDSASDTLTVNGILAPGEPSGGPFGTAEITVAGDLIFSSTAEVRFDLTNEGAFNDRIAVSDAGEVIANSATIQLLPTRAFPVGTSFTLIRNDGTDPIDATPPFRLPSGAPLNEGTEVNVGVNRYRFSYTGGSAPGNDFTARVVAAPPSGVREWDAGGTTRLMSEAANWSANVLPVSSNTLRFSTAAPSLPLGERFPVNDMGGNFYKLEFLAGGYALEESAVSALTDLTLTAGMEASHTSDGVTFEQDFFLAANQTYALTGTASCGSG
jgi:hypothetical protein